MTLKELKILICDDSILIRKKISDALKTMGCHEIFEAADGLRAIEFYEQLKPDLVFMDIVMPTMSGLDALRAIKQLDPNARVVVASSTGTQNHLEEAIKCGVYDFLQKPVETAQLEKIISNVLGEYK